MIGIPTEVRSEERTLGRLGSILTMSAINGALASQQTVALPDTARSAARKRRRSITAKATIRARDSS